MTKDELAFFRTLFKRETVRLVQASGRPIEQGADDLGIGRSTLGAWLVKHREADLLCGPSVQGKRDSADRMCPAKKAVVFFAKETNR
jgi:transposase